MARKRINDAHSAEPVCVVRHFKGYGTWAVQIANCDQVRSHIGLRLVRKSQYDGRLLSTDSQKNPKLYSAQKQSGMWEIQAERSIRSSFEVRHSEVAS